MEKDMVKIIDMLKEPFPFSEVSSKIQVTSTDKLSGMVVFYVQSQAIQERLDKVVGPMNWKNEFLLWQDKSQICGLSIYDENLNQWVTKYNGAENTEREAIKGGLSDAFKRAAVMWGIGRYLSNFPHLWVKVTMKGKSAYASDEEYLRIQQHYEKSVANLNNNTAPQREPKTYTTQKYEPTTNDTMKAPDTPSFEFIVESVVEAGRSLNLKLVNSHGEKLTAFIKKDEADSNLKPGAYLKDVKMQKKEADFGYFYLLNEYKTAA